MKGLPAVPANDPAQLRAAIDLSGNSILLFQCLRTETGSIQAFRLTLANKKAEELAGLDERIMLGKSPEDLFPHTISTEIWDHARHVVDTGEPFEMEISFRAVEQPHDGCFRLYIQAYQDGIAACLTDITTLKQQSHLIESVLNGSINGMIAYEAMRRNPTETGPGELYDLRIRLANKAAARITHIPLHQLIGSTLLTQFTNGHKLGQLTPYAHTIETGETQRIETQCIVDGRPVWFDILFSKLSDGLLMTFVDTTAVKQSQQELQKTVDDLRRSNQNLERFAYVASHDLQEPLRKIQSFGEMLSLQPEGGLSTYSLELIQRMQTAASRMNTLIRDLLTFSRLSSNKQPFQRVDLGNIVQLVLNDLETVIQEKRADVEVTSLPLVFGDGLQLQQLMQNLLSNALKFVKAPENGEHSTTGYRPYVRIDCQRMQGREISTLPGQTVAQADWDRPFFAISVIDNGIGFNEKYLDRIFTIFQRLHTRSEYQGTGIGLAIVQKVIENHNGYLNAHSQLGEGATFTIYLPDEPAPLTLEGLMDSY
jgi:signal transduction histidine kinase